MTAYQELYPKFESYPEAVRQAKRLKGLTIDALVESAGVSYSSVSRLCDGTQLDPKLFNSVALCKVLGLSMDEIFGLSASEASAEELQAKLHAAELGNAHLAEGNKRLHEVNRLRAEQLAARAPVIYILLFACAVLRLDLLSVRRCADQGCRPHPLRRCRPCRVASDLPCPLRNFRLRLGDHALRP